MGYVNGWVDDEVVPHGADVMDWMSFGEVIANVLSPRAPVGVEVPKPDTVADPMIPHQHGLGAALEDVVVGNTIGTFVVSLQRGGSLRVPQVMEGIAEWLCTLPIEEECHILGLCCGGGDCGNDCTEDVDGCIVG